MGAGGFGALSGEDLEAPVVGEEVEKMFDLSHAVPSAESWLLADQAHLSLLTSQVSNVHEWLLKRCLSK